MKSRAIFSFCLSAFLCAPLSAEVLTFSKAYALALENANNIRSSVYVAEAEKEKINQEESQLYPQINLSATYKKTEYESNPAKDITRQGLITYSLTARQSIYNPEVLKRVETQESRSKYSDVKVEYEKEELAQQLFKTYLDILKSHNKIELLKSYLEYNRSKLEELVKKFDMDMSNKMDLLQMRVEYSSAEIELDKEKKLFEVYTLKFKNYIGEIPYELPKIESDKILLETIKQMKNQVVGSQDLQKSLRVQQAQAALQVSQAEIESAKSGHMPKVTFDAAYNKYDTDTPTVDAPYNTLKYMMVSLNLPIYGGGYVSSRVDSSKLMKKAANEDLENAKKEVQVFYDEYLAIFEASSQSVTMYKDALTSAELYLEAIEQGYKYGLKSIIDLNDAKNKLNEVKYKYVENLYSLVDSYIGLLMVTNNFKELNLLDKLVE
ncbi:MAG: outer membrane protein [Campylobacterota bacterium]|nr:outer membrane protein [Campylobacterota bacterium]MDQ1267719.1 outer membrane protein [Campylobacterota bacterium]MDQ1337510.1 outer membrane protein [Campylobacterota bacterium]